ncbi:Nse1 non-SMC component of SMC5-6 complex-domain-containing protein [Phlyctochytrium arcticum]|nr:Nse1 non-SMC component of SMC5-6 complex-domain-containing protein [Phlyctochytrium arcticum]
MTKDNFFRTFLQAFLFERFLSENETVDLLARASEAVGGPISWSFGLAHTLTFNIVPFQRQDLNSVISNLNEVLNEVDMELRRGLEPVNGGTFYALVNTNPDVAQTATNCSPTEIAYFKHLIELIVNANGEAFELSSTAALSEATKMKPAMSKKDAESLIERLVKNKWLVDRNGLLSLSLRTILELQTYLKESYADQIHECTLCMEIVTTDHVRCGESNCATRLHAYCSNSYFARQTNKICPTCQRPWEGVSCGEGIARAFVSDSLQTQRGKAATAVDDEESAGSGAEQDAMDEDVGNSPVEVRSSSRKRPRREVA